MSLIFQNRSLDLSFKKITSAKKWFYGLKRHLELNSAGYKAISRSAYLLSCLKMQMREDLEYERTDKKFGDFNFIGSYILFECDLQNTYISPQDYTRDEFQEVLKKTYDEYLRLNDIYKLEDI